MFRILESAEGAIEIDGVDISKIGLHDCECHVLRYGPKLNKHFLVRSAISIVPQSPDLFEGTLRENIDPVGTYQDADIWVALGQVSAPKLFLSGMSDSSQTGPLERIC